MLSVTLSTDLDVADAFAETATQAPAAMRRAVGVIARGPIAQAMLAELSVPLPKSQSPIDWTSDRQRIAVIIMLKRAGNFPFRATGRHARAWYVNVLEAATASIIVGNSEPGAEFIYGPYPFRQRMHKNKPFAPVIIVKYEPQFQDALITAWLRHNGIKR